MKNPSLILLASLLLSGASVLADYRAEGQIGKGQLGPISQIAITPADSLCVLENNGTVTLFKPDGSVETVIDTGMKNTGAIATAPDGTIHVFSTLVKIKKVKSGARMRKVKIPIGVECGIFNTAGEKLKTTKFENLKSAKAAKIVGNKLVVADLTQRSIIFMDLETGEETGRIKKGLRLCCGIFDFCEAPNDTIAVSNLGAFKFQQFDLDGKLLLEFGKRGRGINDFQGCCNPVSAGYLPDARIVTVEKDPTRIKVYDAKGKNAQQIKGVEELVKGCEFIPVAVDSKGTIYLANTKGHVVKCVNH